MPDLQVLSAPVSVERTTTPVDVQQRPKGEFIMSGSLTRLDSTVPEPVDSSAVMPNFTEREEVHTMIKKLRESVSFWRRIQQISVVSSAENVHSHALPQHRLYIK